MARLCLVLTVAFMILCVPVLNAQTQWTKSPTNPIISAAQAFGAYLYGFDHYHAWMPMVLFDNGIYRMWYIGYGYTPELMSPEWMVGYATSENGKDWFMYHKNPVLMPGSYGTFDDNGIWGGTVIRDGSQFVMYYGARNSSTSRMSIGYATSSDGIHWTKRSAPVLVSGTTGSWDDNGVSAPSVIKEAPGQYRMWYSGATGSTVSMGYATSIDGINWTKNEANPVLSRNASNQWESYLVTDGRVVKVGTTYHMLYHGAPGVGGYQIGHASSTDGITWSRYGGNPVLHLGQPGSWEDFTLSQHWFVWQDSTFKLWYGARDNTYQIFQIGYATSPLTPTDVQPVKETPREFRLQQNYPNPFNPSTTIEYDVPARAHITLKVYNALGQEIATLVDDERTPGSYSAVWDARGVASGTYWSRLTADGRSMVQKMILVK